MPDRVMAGPRGVWRQVLTGWLIGLADITIITVLFAHGTDFRKHFIIEVYNYTFETSMFDLWTCGLLRACILLGGSLGFACNAVKATPRIETCRPVIIVISTIMWVLTIIKMLAFTENQKDYNLPWFWSLFAWSNIACLLMSITWYFILKVKIDGDIHTRNINVNSSDDERSPLIGSTSEEEEEEEEKKNKEKMSATIGRLLKCSAPDWYLVLGAFTFLTLSSLGLYPLLYFYFFIWLNVVI